MHAQIVLFDGFDPLDVVAPYEVLHAGAIAAAGALRSVTRPMRLNLDFAVIVEGETLTGTSRAGRLPASMVTGARRPARPGAEAER